MMNYASSCHRLRRIACGKDLWERYVEAAQPDGARHFGRNLHAFWDAISGGGPGWPGDDVELVFRNSESLAALTSGSGPSYLDLMQRFARDLHAVKITLL